MRIADFLKLPTDTELDSFIVRLDDVSSDLRNERIREYVLPRKVEEQLDNLLRVAGERLRQKRDIGRFLYGSFGCGKSHLMLILNRMLSRDETVYALGDEGLRRLKQAHPWLSTMKILAAGSNLMKKKSLARALYEAFNDALPEGAPKAEFASHEARLETAENNGIRLAGSLEAFIQKLVEGGVIPSAAFYERMRKGALAERQELAANVWNWFFPSDEERLRPENMWLDPRDGFDLMSRHAASLGYDAIAFQIDELIIWLREKERAEYIREINTLSSLVDHDGTANRPVPFFILSAVQRDIVETCPDDLSEKDFRDQLGFIRNRFEPHVQLEDTDLYEVCERRVLRRKDEAAKAVLDAEIEKVLEKHKTSLETLAADIHVQQVRALYPFHPALIRALMDTTEAFSRSRTGIQILYALLVKYLPDLETGQFIPLGTLFDAVFTTSHMVALRQHVKGELTQQLVRTYETYEKLQPLLRAQAGTGDVCPYDASSTGCSGCTAKHPDEAHLNCFQLNQLVKSVLLCQLSKRPFYSGGRRLSDSITVRNLMRFNLADIRTTTELTGSIAVLQKLRGVAAQVSQVRVTGNDGSAVVSIDIQAVNTDEVLAEAVHKVTHADRVSFLRKLLDEELGLQLGSGMEAARTVSWRGTKRKGKVRLCNVRTLQYAGQTNEFDAGDGAFLILVDMPFDEVTGMGPDDDEDRVNTARSRKRQWTTAWLPGHFDAAKQKALTQAAAIELIRGDRSTYLENRFKTSEASQALQQLSNFQMTQSQVLREEIRKVYLVSGKIAGMQDGLELTMAGLDPNKAIETLAQRILDVRYPSHPRFPKNVDRGSLDLVVGYCVQAALTAQPISLTTTNLDLVRQIGEPLELAYASVASVTARSGGKYASEVSKWAGQRSNIKGSDMRRWLMDDADLKFGLTKEVADALILYLQQVEGYEALGANGEGITITTLQSIPAEFTLRKDEVVDLPTWKSALTAADKVFAISGRSDIPTSPEQSKLARDAEDKARLLLRHLAALENSLKELVRYTSVPAQESKRLRSVQDTRRRLEEVTGASKNAEKVRKVASLWPAPPGMMASLADLVNECHAAGAFEAIHSQITTVGSYGTPEEKAPVEHLKRLLADGPEVRLAPEEARLANQIEASFKEVMKRVMPPPPPPPPPVPDGTKVTPVTPEVTAAAAAVKKAEVAERAGSLAKSLLENLDGNVFDVKVTVTRKS